MIYWIKLVKTHMTKVALKFKEGRITANANNNDDTTE